MNRHDGGASKAFHETPLVLFTAVTTAGAGIGAAGLVLGLLGWTSGIATMGQRIWVLLLLGFGLVVSTAHLGRPLRSPKALARVGRSALSNEVALIGVAATGCLGALLLPDGHSALVWLWPAAAFACLMVLFILGGVYRIPGQLTWEGVVSFHPLILGMGFGFVALRGSLVDGVDARLDLLVLVFLAVDALLVWARARRIFVGLRRGLPTQPAIMEYRTAMLVLRMGLGVIVPATAILFGVRPVAFVSLALNLPFDRVLFYGLAIRHSTEAEIHRVENVLSAADEAGTTKGSTGGTASGRRLGTEAAR